MPETFDYMPATAKEAHEKLKKLSMSLVFWGATLTFLFHADIRLNLIELPNGNFGPVIFGGVPLLGITDHNITIFTSTILAFRIIYFATLIRETRRHLDQEELFKNRAESADKSFFDQGAFDRASYSIAIYRIRIFDRTVPMVLGLIGIGHAIYFITCS